MNLRPIALVIIVILGMLAMTSMTAAHDTEVVDGYAITFGGSDEPVITGERMWLEVSIEEEASEEPVEGVEDSLSIAVQEPFGNDTRELDAAARFGEPGSYEAPIMFTEPGTYRVFINGTINDTQVSVSFQKQVHDRSELAYPPNPDSEETNGTLSSMSGGAGVAAGAAIAMIGMGAAFVVGRRL